MNFFIGFGGGEKIGTTRNGSKAFVRTKVSRPVRASAAEVPSGTNDTPKAAPAPEPGVIAHPTEPEKPNVTPEAGKPAPSAETAMPPPSTVTEGPVPTPKTPVPAATPGTVEPVTAEWTEVQDALLRDLKQQGKSWKEIEEALPGQGKVSLKERHRKLCAETQKEKADDLKEEKKAVVQEQQIGKRSNLKESKVKKDEVLLKKVGDRPIICVDSGDQLDAEQVRSSVSLLASPVLIAMFQLARLYKLHAKAERLKWVDIASRFFDKTGKRISPEVLKEKLQNC
ncbi:MAG: hypothetical protein Q9163_000990 [Psora crenata]